jgi:hypothetical protein
LVEYRWIITPFFCFLFYSVTLAIHVTSFNVVMHSFTMGFGPSQQGLLALGIIHGGMTVSLHQSFISFYFMYNIDSLFVLINCYQKNVVWFICYRYLWFKSDHYIAQFYWIHRIFLISLQILPLLKHLCCALKKNDRLAL